MANGAGWRRVALVVVGCIALAELTSAAALKVLGRPVYWTADIQVPPPSETPKRSEKDLWGAWGKPNTSSRLVGQCFDVAYTYNSMGARDVERKQASPKRWVVLGDSFVEGYGIEQPQRFTNLLEQRSAWEFANFGASGDHGPLQYMIVYQLLAKQLEHQGVIVGLLPFNDFTDNDPEWWRRNKSAVEQARYRPYAIVSPDQRSYRAIYGANADALPRDDFDKAPDVADKPSPEPTETENSSLSIREIARFFSEYSATFSFLRQISSEMTQRDKPYDGGYFTDDKRAITAARLALEDLSEDLGDRKKVILLFPADSDLAERERRGVKYSDEIAAFLSKLSDGGWRIIDLADAVTEAYHAGEITLGCDGHWNAETNRIVADYLLANYGDLLTGQPTN